MHDKEEKNIARDKSGTFEIYIAWKTPMQSNSYLPEPIPRWTRKKIVFRPGMKPSVTWWCRQNWVGSEGLRALDNKKTFRITSENKLCFFKYRQAGNLSSVWGRSLADMRWCTCCRDGKAEGSDVSREKATCINRLCKSVCILHGKYICEADSAIVCFHIIDRDWIVSLQLCIFAVLQKWTAWKKDGLALSVQFRRKMLLHPLLFERVCHKMF